MSNPIVSSPTHPQGCAAEAPVGTEELSSCPWCGGKRFRKKWTSYDRLTLVNRQTYSYQHCRGCGLIFQSPRPVEEDISRYYPDRYGPYQAAPGSTTPEGPSRPSVGKRLLGRAFRRLVEVTDRYFPRSFEKRYYSFYQPPHPGLALLDYGCGSDRFLNEARSLGWDTTGMDFSQTAVEQARASGHRALMCGDQAWRELADGSFHFVRLSHVLEHLYRPREDLRQLASKMAPGAMLHLALPNPRSLSSRVFGSHWFSLDCPRHIMLYSVGFLRRELPLHGFDLVHVLHEPATKDFARSLAYRRFDQGRISHRQIDGHLQHRLLNDVLTVPMRLLAGMGCGERIHVFACRSSSGV